MDFIALYTLHDADLKLLTFSYDIACQWSRNLKDRIRQLPSIMQPPNRVIDSTKFVIPKMHIYGHGKSCQTRYSLNFLKYSARTDGEDPERWWAHINPVTTSTREMGPGSRQDTIDDHAAAWNFCKIIGFGEYLIIFFSAYSDTVLAKDRRCSHNFRTRLKCGLSTRHYLSNFPKGLARFR
jgi:hypothetical protein